MYEINASSTIRGRRETVWAVAADVAGWPSWDPHEEGARLDGPFAPGTTGWSKPRGAPPATWTITEVEPQALWASECALPGGRLSGVNTFEDVGGGAVRCTKTVRVTGPLVPLFRLWFGPRIRRDLQRTFAALQAEVARREAAVPAAGA